MVCRLKHCLGVPTECELDRCVYWRAEVLGAAHPQGRSAAAECVLDTYRLVGMTADTTARWLYDYKMSVQRSRMETQLVALLAEHQSRSRSRSMGVA